MRRRLRSLALEKLEARDLFAFGDLDAAYGVGGLATTSFFAERPSQDVLTDAALQGDGKIVSVGGVRLGAADVSGITRLLPDGTLDASFGDGGVLLTDNEPFGIESGTRSVVIQPDGKIVLARDGDFGEVRLTRYSENGQLDLSFGVNGAASYRAQFVNVSETLLRADGRILVVGRVVTGVINGQWSTSAVLLQFDSHGQLDANFGQGGVVITTVSDYQDSAADVALQPDGQIVVSGSSTRLNGERLLFVARYSADGVPDEQFGDGPDPGVVRIENFGRSDLSAGSDAVGIVVQPSGRVLLAATRKTSLSTADFTLVAIRADGRLDAAFGPSGSTGIVTTPIPGLNDAGARDLVLDSDGRIVVVGASTLSGQGIVARYTESGILDAAWDADGVAASPELDNARRLLALGDGEVLAAFTGFSATKFAAEDFGAARFSSQGVLDAAFGVSGIVLHNFLDGASATSGSAAVVQADGKLIQVGQCTSATGTLWCVSRLDSSGELDASFGADGRTIVGIEAADAAPLPLISPDGKIVLVGNAWTNSGSQMELVRLTPDGQLDASWGVGGYAFLDFDADYVYPVSAQVQRDGRIVVLGFADDGSGFETKLLRILTNGARDPSFGSNGAVTLEVAYSGPDPSRLLLQADGRIIAVTNRTLGSQRVVEVRRRLANGQPDLAWGHAGSFSTALGDADETAFCGAAAFTSQGQVLVGCRNAVSPFILRLLADGTADGSFGTGGRVEAAPISVFGAEVQSLVVLPSGDFATIGWDRSTLESSQTGGLVQFFRPDGSPNDALGDDGIVRLERQGGSVLSIDGRLSADGNLLLAGRWSDAIDSSFLAAQIDGDGSPYLPWHHADDPLDVDHDPAHSVTPADALLIVNDLNLWGARALAPPSSTSQPYAFLDVDGDRHAAPRDALLVINYLNGQSGGEGEIEAFDLRRLPLPDRGLAPISRSLDSEPSMPYDSTLAGRVRDYFGVRTPIVEKKMFGGVAFLSRGNMLVGVWESWLIARIGSDAYADALTQPHVAPFDVTGKPMKGWVMISTDGLDRDAQLAAWIARAERFAATLPAKP
ncbi:MAG: TfoX/Sxy family protein [Pirellulales bacterium]